MKLNQLFKRGYSIVYFFVSGEFVHYVIRRLLVSKTLTVVLYMFLLKITLFIFIAQCAIMGVLIIRRMI